MHGFNFGRTGRSASQAFGLPGSVNWWAPVRGNVIQASGLKEDAGGGTQNNPVITYISRQNWGRRMLIPADHDKLVEELYKLRDEHGYEVNVVEFDKISRREQIQISARTTVSSVDSIDTNVVDLGLDYDGCSRKWFDILSLDETITSKYCYGVCIPWRFRARLRVYNSSAGHGTLLVLGQRVSTFI